jgi:hypothetical protein
MLNKLKIPGVLFWERFNGVVISSSVEPVVVKGKIIRMRMEEGEEPSQELIDEAHRCYVDEVERLYTKYRHLNRDKPLKFY